MAEEIIPANNVLFSNFCKLLEDLQKKQPKAKQNKTLLNYIEDFRSNAAKLDGKKNLSLFPILRLLLPTNDRERSAYNLKETKLKSLLIKVLSPNKHEAQRLLNFKSHAHASDLPGVVYYIIKNKVGKESGLTIGKVNEILDKISLAEVGNKGPILDEAFSYALNNMLPEHFKWFLRVILKDLKIHMGITRILSSFHPDAPELFESCGNLAKVCEDLDEGNTRPIELGVQVFYAVAPMLSERCDVTRLSELPTQQYQIENKFDGERFQMHMQNGVFEYFSRRGHTYGEQYGKGYDSGGLLTPKLRDCFSPSVTSFVLDGEMMGWHKTGQYFGSKGLAYDVKKITDKSQYQPCFCAFDVLYYNGKSLVGSADRGGLPLSDRLNILDGMFTDVRGVIQHSRRKMVTDPSEILDALNKAIEDQDEGIVIKNINSYYLPNKRDAGWYKIKPEYTKGTMSDLDLVIIGAEEAANKTHGFANSFYVACRDNSGVLERWLCVGRVSTGLTHEQRASLCSQLERHWTQTRVAPPPHCLYFNKQKPDFWVLPENSVVLEVRATELIRSTDYGTSHTLRFPRVVHVRDDKPCNDVLTVEQFNNLIKDKGAVVKLSTNLISADNVEEIPAAKRRRVVKATTVAPQFRRAADKVPATSATLVGREVCVLSADHDDRDELIDIIASHGGKHVQNCGPNTWCGIAGKITHRVSTIIKSKELNVLPTSWLRSLPPSPRPCDPAPLDYLSMTPKTARRLRLRFDSFGDSYTEPTDADALKRCFEKMGEEDTIHLTNAEMLNLDKLLFEDNNPYSFLRPCYIGCIKDDLLALRAQMYGAHICDISSVLLTHLVLSSGEKYDDVKEVIKNSQVHVVSEKWLESCIAQERLLPEYL